MKLRDTVLAFFGGIFLTLSLAPFNIWPLAVLATALLFYTIGNHKPKCAFWMALIFSFSLFLSGASWVFVSIHEFGYAPAPLAAFLTLLFCLALALVNATAWLAYAVFRSARNGPITRSALDIILFASVGTFSEWLRSWLFSGFPWLYAGYSQTDAILAAWGTFPRVICRILTR